MSLSEDLPGFLRKKDSAKRHYTTLPNSGSGLPDALLHGREDYRYNEAVNEGCDGVPPRQTGFFAPDSIL